MENSIRELDIDGYDQLTFHFTACLATMYNSVGLERMAGFYYYDTAGVAYFMGDWKTARQYYREALGYPLGEYHRQKCCVQLAELEDDLQVADKLLQIACPTNSPTDILYEATDFAWRTGSEDLFEHYLKRLQAQDPSTARQLEELPSVSVMDKIIEIQQTTR